MNETSQTLSARSFAKTFVLPALLIFVVPVFAYLFFWHAQSVFDGQARTAALDSIQKDPELTEERRALLVEYFTKVPFSRHIVRNPEIAEHLDPGLRFNYATFRWMLILSGGAILSGIAVFVMSGLCVWWSLRSQLAQYRCLQISWYFLRFYGAVQTIILGVLLVGLSYWVTALWFQMYSVKIVAIAGLLACVGVWAVIKAIFATPKHEFVVEGKILDEEAAGPMWTELREICAKVGTAPPNRIIAGIDDNFFVTENPVTVDGTQYEGKTLFVSLPLLKQLRTEEAASILAHEMAHFSGDDTLYTRKISPLLKQYTHYLNGLYEQPATKPIFHFMYFFRMLFELSLGKLSREREFRADSIAASVTSPKDCAAALLRTVAYSTFRRSIEVDLFKQQRVLEVADVSDRIEQGFVAYASQFGDSPEMSQQATAHPFDSHPSISQRLNAYGIQLTPTEAADLLATPADGGWYQKITDAFGLEKAQWSEFEARFRENHQQSLAYRLLPETADEQVIVEAAFPSVTFDGRDGNFTMDFEKIQLTKWVDPIYYREIARCEFRNDRMLEIHYTRKGERSRDIDVKSFGKDRVQELLGVFQRYYGRYLAAADFHAQSVAKPEPETPPTPTQDDSTTEQS